MADRKLLAAPKKLLFLPLRSGAATQSSATVPETARPQVSTTPSSPPSCISHVLEMGSTGEHGSIHRTPYRIDILIAFVLAMVALAYSMSGIAPNIIVACILGEGAICAVLHYFLAWSRNVKKFNKSRWIIIIAIQAFTIVLAWSPVTRQYLVQHPKPPILDIAIQTIPGLPSGVSNNPHLRYRVLRIQNHNDVSIENFCSRLQLPEPIYATIQTDLPPGITIDWQPILTRYSISGTGARSFLGPQSTRQNLLIPTCFVPNDHSAQLGGFSDGGDTTGVWQLTIDRLPPRGVVALWFLTASEGDATNYISLASTVFKTNGASFNTTIQGTTNGGVILHNLTWTLIVQRNKVIDTKADWHFGTNELRFFFEGLYQYQSTEKLMEHPFFVPLVFDTNSQAISSLAIQSGIGKWRTVIIDYQ